MRHGVPKVIYLQICDDPDCDVPYDDHDGITWCSHRIDKTDVKYVLAKDKPQRTWVDLNTNQILDIYQEVLKEWRGGHQVNGQIEFAKAIQDKLKEVNT